MENSRASSAARVPAMPQRGGKAALRWGLAALGLVVAALVIWQLGAQVPRLALWVEGLGFWGPLVFVVLYAALTVAAVPAFLLTLAAGAIFGLLKGVIVVFAAATLGASAAFLIARYAARAAVERRVAGNRRFEAVDRAIGEQGRRMVFLLRLSPVFPFNLLNYALGLTSVRFRDYLVACLGMIPGTLLYVGLCSTCTPGNWRETSRHSPGARRPTRACWTMRSGPRGSSRRRSPP
jgi:uncharacterized membrane protein YdjX (TVP38/TMEM64 family)